MDVDLDFHVEIRADGQWYATERDNYAQWGSGSTIGEALQDYCDKWLPDDFIDDSPEGYDEEA